MKYRGTITRAVKKLKFRRFGISAGSKVQQANLRALARDMADDPGLLIPDCAGQCRRCQFDRLLAKLRKIQASRGNPVALKRLAGSGKQLERGYASMLMLAAEEGPIMFAAAKLPGQDVSYTVRGKVRKEVLIGLQHFDDPKLRLLAYSEFAVKNKVHIYSSDEELACTGREPKYPAALIDEVLASTGYRLKKASGGYACEHQGVGCELKVSVLSAGTSVGLCKACASRKENLHAALLSRVVCKHPESDLEVSLGHDIRCAKGNACSVPSKSKATAGLLAKYRAGELSDRALLEDYESAVRAGLEQAGRTIYVLGDRCFEDDAAAFIVALAPSDIEAKALKRVLAASQGPVIMSDATPSAVLALTWDWQGANAIHAVTGDKELARKVFLENRESGKPPSQILREAVSLAKSREALAGLPEFKALGKVGRYADDLARTHRALGREEALRKIGGSQKDTKLKSVDCGFLTALGGMKGREWQFTREELDYGCYLADFARALLDAKPEDYADALQNLLTASGSGENAA